MKLKLDVLADTSFRGGPQSDLSPEPPEVTSVRSKLLEMLEPAGQEQTDWCWAASSQMLVGHLRGEAEAGVSQFALACERANARRAIKSEPPIDGSDKKLLTPDERKEINRGSWPNFLEFHDRAQSTWLGGARDILLRRGVKLAPGERRMTYRGELDDEGVRALCEDTELALQIEDLEDYALSWDALTRLLDADCPVAFSRRWSGNGGHMMVACGYVVTPPNKRWVAVVNPLPPGNGDWYLLPYEQYVHGSDERHWRDYWIPLPPPGPEREGPMAHPLAGLAWDQCVVRHSAPQWPAEWATPRADEDPPRPVLPPVPGLSEDEVAAAHRAAQNGFEALKLIAKDAPKMALAMGMGGNFFQLLGKPVLPALARLARRASAPSLASEAASAILPELPNQEQVAAELGVGVSVNPEELSLDLKPLPEYKLSKADLAKWDGTEPDDLLARPTQLHWNVSRKELEPFSFFATITVHRTKDGDWRVASLGRMALMQTQGLVQLFSPDVWKDRTVAELFGLFGKLDVIEPLWTTLWDLRSDVADELQDPENLSRFLEVRKAWEQEQPAGPWDEDVNRVSDWFKKMTTSAAGKTASAKKFAANVDAWLEATQKMSPAERTEIAETVARVLDRRLLLGGLEQLTTARESAVELATKALDKLKEVSDGDSPKRRELFESASKAILGAADTVTKLEGPLKKLAQPSGGPKEDAKAAAKQLEEARATARKMTEHALELTAKAVAGAGDEVGRDAIDHARAVQRMKANARLIEHLSDAQLLNKKRKSILKAAKEQLVQQQAEVERKAKAAGLPEEGQAEGASLGNAEAVIAAIEALKRAAEMAEDAAREVRMIVKRSGAKLPPEPPGPKPESAISVQDLYHLFLVDTDGGVQPIYREADFYGPGERIDKGNKMQVLSDLKALAMGNDVGPRP